MTEKDLSSRTPRARRILRATSLTCPSALASRRCFVPTQRKNVFPVSFRNARPIRQKQKLPRSPAGNSSIGAVNKLNERIHPCFYCRFIGHNRCRLSKVLTRGKKRTGQSGQRAAPEPSSIPPNINDLRSDLVPDKTIKRRLQAFDDATLASDDGPIFSAVAKLVEALRRAIT